METPRLESVVYTAIRGWSPSDTTLGIASSNEIVSILAVPFTAIGRYTLAKQDLTTP